MRRRNFIALLGNAAAWPLAARAQQPTIPIVGYVHADSPQTVSGLLAAFRENDVDCQEETSSLIDQEQSRLSHPRSALSQRDPSWASNGNGTERRTQAVTILSRSARRWRDPSRTALTISGGEVKGVPPGNGGAGSYSIES